MASLLPPAADALVDVVIALDADGEILDWNDAFTEWVTPEALPGASLAGVVGEREAADVESAIETAVESGQARVEATLATDDGGAPYEFRIDRWEPDGGRDLLLAVGREIADRKHREEILATLNRVATAMQGEQTVESVCERTVRTAETLLEFEMCSILVREGSWLEPYAISEGAPSDGSRRMRVDQGLAGKTVRTGDSYVVDRVQPDDETDPAKEAYESGISVPIGEYGVFQAVATEPGAFDDSDVELAELLVTHTAAAIERIERERDLERQNGRLERFASVVSHDLRSPLNVAVGRLDMVREDCDSEHIDDVAAAHDRMATLIEDVLALARAGESATERESVRLADATRRTWETVDTTGATLAVETDGVVRADESKLRQLLANLVRNAVEHAGPGVTVTVDTLADGEGFYVADDGPGIPADEREEVFEFGYSTAEEGTGFGLNIVADVAEAHGWDVRVTESADGGARFEVTGVEFA